MPYSSSNYSFHSVKVHIIQYLHYIYEFLNKYIKIPIINFYYRCNYCNENINNTSNEVINEINNNVTDISYDEEIADNEMIIRKISYSDINEIHEISITNNSISKFINHNYILKDQ